MGAFFFVFLFSFLFSFLFVFFSMFLFSMLLLVNGQGTTAHPDLDPIEAEAMVLMARIYACLDVSEE